MVTWGSERIGEVTLTYDGSLVIIHGPATDGPETVVDPGPDALREWTRTDASGRYRPLTGARTMRPGWQARCNGATALADAIDAIYPLALQHAQDAATDSLRVVGLDTVLARQTGRYAVAADLDAEGRDAARAALCGRCVRVPVWAGAVAGAESIPCPEPCAMFVSLCREAATWQASPPVGREPDKTVPFGAFDMPGNEVREAFLAIHDLAARSGR